MRNDDAKLLIWDDADAEVAPIHTPRWIRAGAILGGVALATGLFASVAFADEDGGGHGGDHGGDHHGKHHGDGDDHVAVAGATTTTVAVAEAENTAPVAPQATPPTQVKTPPTNVAAPMNVGAQFNALTTAQLTMLANALGLNANGLNLNEVSLDQLLDLAHDRGCSRADVSMILSGITAASPALPAASSLSSTCSLIR